MQPVEVIPAKQDLGTARNNAVIIARTVDPGHITGTLISLDNSTSLQTRYDVLVWQVPKSKLPLERCLTEKLESLRFTRRHRLRLI